MMGVWRNDFQCIKLNGVSSSIPDLVCCVHFLQKCKLFLILAALGSLNLGRSHSKMKASLNSKREE